MGAGYLKPTLRGKRGNKSIAGLHPETIFIFSQYNAYPLQDREYAIFNTFIIRRLFLPTTMWASIYAPADALLSYVVHNVYGIVTFFSEQNSYRIAYLYALPWHDS